MTKEDLITAYFEGTLSQEDQRTFEDLLKRDMEFLKEFQFQKELQSALQNEERRKTKIFLNSLENTSSNKGTKIGRLVPWFAAASIVILVGLGSWFYFFNSPKINTQELYAAYYKPYENIVHPLERGKQLEDLESRAFLAYELEDYQLAFELFKELGQQKNDSYIAFYNAIVLMQLGNFDEAISLFNGYIQNDSLLNDRAHWYLALCYLKLNDLEKAKKELDLLIQLKSFNLEKAKELKEKLD